MGSSNSEAIELMNKKDLILRREKFSPKVKRGKSFRLRETH